MKTHWITAAAFALALLPAVRADTLGDYPIAPVPYSAVRLEAGVWGRRLETNRTVTVRHTFKQCEEVGAIDNFAKAARQMSGSFRGAPHADSDVFKVLEGAVYSLATHPDPELQTYVDNLIAKIGAAQELDGYLYTARTVHPDNPPGIACRKRWVNVCADLVHLGDSHELYNLGHLIEAAVAHYEATGKRTLLDIAVKSADLIDSVWGPGRLDIPPGHQEIEIALARLYRVTGKRSYLDLAHYLLECRGRGKGSQDLHYANHLPVTNQTELIGHAVRSAYMCAAIADIAAIKGDADYGRTAATLWEDMAARKLSLNGSLGARVRYEQVGGAYELPNAGAHNETCAAIGNAFWTQRMFLLSGDSRYLDVLERTLYNGVLPTVSLSGDRFFYLNPLAADDKRRFNHGRRERAPWFGTPCCPVNVVRFIPTVPGLAYAVRERTVYICQYMAGQAQVSVNGGKVTLRQITNYPWDGTVRIEVAGNTAGRWKLNLRIPGWVYGRPVPTDLYRYLDPAPREPGISINGERTDVAAHQGFAGLERPWKRGDVVELKLPMPVRRVLSHEKVSTNEGLVALERGPILYCVEGADHGGRVESLVLTDDTDLRPEHRPSLLGGVTVLRGKAAEASRRKDGSVTLRPAALTAIPYNVWRHRGPSPMKVFLPRTAAKALPLPYPTIANRARAIASYKGRGDTLDALNDQVVPQASGDREIPRFTWWNRRGTQEWVQYDFAKPTRIGGVEVYWYDDGERGQSRAPRSWGLTWFDGDTWRPVPTTQEPGILKDQFNRLPFKPVTAVSLRLEVQLRPDFSGGVLEWRVVE